MLVSDFHSVGAKIYFLRFSKKIVWVEGSKKIVGGWGGPKSLVLE